MKTSEINRSLMRIFSHHGRTKVWWTMLVGPTKRKHFIHTYNKKIIFLITMQ